MKKNTITVRLVNTHVARGKVLDAERETQVRVSMMFETHLFTCDLLEITIGMVAHDRFAR